MENNCHLMFCHDRRNHFRLYSWDSVFVQKGMHCKACNIFDTILKTFPICRWQTIAISCFAIIEEITLDYFYGMLCLSKKVLVSWGSEATPSATPFFKRAYKISHPPRLWAFWDALPSFASSAQSAKIGLSKGIFYVKNHPNLSESRIIANFLSPCEKWGRRRCRFRPSWH